MDIGTVLSVAQTLFNALQCSELRDFCSILGYKTQLADLENTVKTVQAVLLDAEAKSDTEGLSHQAQLFVEELKDAVYEADDLLDEFVTLAQRKHKKLFKDDTSKVVPHKVRNLFSRIKDLPFAYRMSQGVKGIRKKLDSIADNHNKFGFKLDSQRIRKRREETCSYVYAQDIIGRDDDKEKIVGMLLDPNVRNDVSYLTIVGIGGLGKTTLAQLIYNDDRIMKEFPTRLWACVGDEDTNHLNVKAVLAKILELDDNHDHKTLDSLQRKVREKLEGKCLLVLDDVWNENPREWLKLENLLKGGPKGSWVVVTTRSRNTAEIIKGGSLFELHGLSDEDSWHLFKMVAFKETKGETTTPDMVEIGKNIVKKCANVPLAIRVIGSLLYDQGEDKWLSFKKKGLVESSSKTNDIFSILKFSYHQLDSRLKSCFGYCGLFPKDHEIEKEMLIWLWMAQGYIMPFEKDQSIEDAGEAYFLILLRRCFFQDVRKNKYGEIISFKLHDLMHDVAQQVSENEVCVVDCITSDLNKKICHFSVVKHVGTTDFLTKGKMRSFLYLSWHKMEFSVDTLLENWMNLRALDLSRSNIEILPNTIGKLFHLRYLDLSRNHKLKVLPNSLTKLYNLETLILTYCGDLIELPHNFCKLIKLRCLDMEGCDKMTHMPTSMGKLRCLHKLTMFAVDLSNAEYGDQLESLGDLNEIKDHINFRIHGSKDARDSAIKGGIFINKRHLNEIKFRFGGDYDDETLMEHMQPHAKLKKLSLEGYICGRLPSWTREDNLTRSLPNLVNIKITDCGELKYLGPLEQLRHLRFLTLEDLWKLEYVDNRTRMESTAVEGSAFFTSPLEKLKLWNLPRLKGWWREEDDDSRKIGNDKGELNHLSSLETLLISNCPNLTLIDEFCSFSSSSSLVSSSACPPFPLTLHHLTLSVLPKLKNLPDWMQHLTNLQSLSFFHCEALESVPKWMPHLTSLTRLKIWNCSGELKRRCCESPPGQDWPYIQHIPTLSIKKNPWNI